MKALKYDYHDAIIDKLKIIGNVLTIFIDLYPIFYPSKPKIKLMLEVAGSDMEFCINWINRLMGEFDDGEDYFGVRVGNIKNESADNKTSLFKIACDSMQSLHLKCLSFTEAEVGKEFFAEGQLLKIYNNVLEKNLKIEEWTIGWLKKPDYGLFHMQNFEGCFSIQDQAFSLSFCDDNDEYLIQLTLQQIKEIKKGSLKSVWGFQVGYQND